MLVASYEYDSLGQVIRENNAEADKTWVYSYDDRGNITSRKTYNGIRSTATNQLGAADISDSYTYFEQWEEAMWGDGLKSYNGSPTLIYDAIGNPLSYNNGSSYTLTWEEGRRLSGGTKGSSSFEYSYNADGLRTKKISGNLEYNYYWQGSQLAAMTIGNLTSGNITSVCKFYYDSNGLPMVFDYNGTKYLYVTNLQGDVVGLANEYGESVLYCYDAWGRITGTDAASSSDAQALSANPLRYRGYVYDSETGFYYLHSRYYDPATGRFINADGVVAGADGSVQGYNLYAYCFNNPVNMSDNDGTWPSWATKIAIGIGAVLVGAAVVAATAATGGAAAAFVGAAVAGLKAAALSGAIGAVVGAGTSAVSHRVSTGSWSGAEKAIVEGAVDGFASGFMWGGISAGATFTTVAAKGVKIKEIGKITGANAKKGYSGVRYQNKAGSYKSIEIHPNHNGHGIHLQKNTWWYNTKKYPGQPFRAYADWRFTLFK